MTCPTPKNVSAALTLSALLLAAVPAAAADEAADVRALSQGYALLYQAVEKLDRLPKVLYAKLESDPVDELATHIGEGTSAALEEIEAYAESHPGIDLEDAGLPPVERERRSSTSKALLKEMATTSGTEFERIFLMSLVSLLNQTRHTAAVLAEMPQDEAGKRLARRWHERFEADYRKVRELFVSDYFRSPEDE